jgi:hypothetical protein
MQLPVEYRRQGISIGDVGIITSTGTFDFLFNIFLPANHPINIGNVPQTFSPLSREQVEREIQKTCDYGPNSYVTSSTARKTAVRETKAGRSWFRQAVIPPHDIEISRSLCIPGPLLLPIKHSRVSQGKPPF